MRSARSSICLALRPLLVAGAVVAGAGCGAASSRPPEVANRSHSGTAEVAANEPADLASNQPASKAGSAASNEPALHSGSAAPNEPASHSASPAPNASTAHPVVDWLKERVPAGTEVSWGDSGAVLTHRVRQGETYAQIADAHVPWTDVYLASDLLIEMSSTNQVRKGTEPRAGELVVIPHAVQSPFKNADDERLGWPEDKALRGLYVRGLTAGGSLYAGLLRHMAERGINAIVLDSKDYDGWLTYPSKVPLALETGAVHRPPIRDLARAIRFAHAKGIRVISRIATFEDELVSKAKGKMSVQAKWGRPYKIGWFDPHNEEAQQYVIDLAKEAMDAGTDEIELDYIRYPVLGIKGAAFDLPPNTTKIDVIRDFVHRIHAVTQARRVPLSLDIFGVVAEGNREDIEMLGQDPPVLAQECEVLSPMVYPSHYRTGYLGFEIPGNHPEITGIGVGHLRKQIRNAKVTGGAAIRPWLQAVEYRSPEYGPAYIAKQIKSVDSAGAAGWLMWNPAQTYTVTWQAIAPRRQELPPVAGASSPVERGAP